jgi:hypothetical protein
MVCKLDKSVYGLTVSGRNWYETYERELGSSLGMRKVQSDQAVFFSRQGKIITIIIVYVDDSIVMTNSVERMSEVKEKLGRIFDMKCLGEPNVFLGIEIKRDRKHRTLKISQEKYANDILEKFGMSDCRPANVPMGNIDDLFKTDYAPFPISEYMTALGSLMYLSHTRPDLALPLAYLSRFASQPLEHHYVAIKRVMRYVNHTKNHGILYGGDQGQTPKAWVDADFARDPRDRKSTSAYVFCYNQGAVAFKAHKQSTVALSTRDAEYMALSEAVSEAIWEQNLLRELDLTPGSVTIHEDNTSAITLATNPVDHARTKHIDIRHHHIRDAISRGQVNLVYVESEHNIADALTKNVPRAVLEKHKVSMGMTA